MAQQGAPAGPPPASGEQLKKLKMELSEKRDSIKDVIDQDEEAKDALFKELKAITGKLDQVDRRLKKMTVARKEYTKTLQECNFALDKIQAAAEQMQGRFGAMDRVTQGGPSTNGIPEGKPRETMVARIAREKKEKREAEEAAAERARQEAAAAANMAVEESANMASVQGTEVVDDKLEKKSKKSKRSSSKRSKE